MTFKRFCPSDQTTLWNKMAWGEKKNFVEYPRQLLVRQRSVFIAIRLLGFYSGTFLNVKKTVEMFYQFHFNSNSNVHFMDSCSTSTSFSRLILFAILSKCERGKVLLNWSMGNFTINFYRWNDPCSWIGIQHLFEMFRQTIGAAYTAYTQHQQHINKSNFIGHKIGGLKW